MNDTMSACSVLLDVKWNMDGREIEFDKALPDFKVINWEARGETNPDLSSVKYAVVWKPDSGLLARCDGLEVIFSLGAGVDHLLTDPDLPDLPIVRFVDPDLTGRMVEWVVLQTLMHLRQQRAYDALQRGHEWRELSQPAAADLRVGIMGMGELGKACANALLPFGFKINGWSRSQKQFDGVTGFAGLNAFGDFLGQTDILICLLPLTDETRHIINSKLIDQLAKDGPFGAPIIINAGRGGSQVEEDIVAALHDGRLYGASLDVFETEPLSMKSPLWDMANVIITPHAAAVSNEKALAAHVARQIARHEAGKALENLVDRSRGY